MKRGYAVILGMVILTLTAASTGNAEPLSASDEMKVMGRIISDAFLGSEKPVRLGSKASVNAGLPFSFTYDGKPSSEFLAGWDKSSAKDGKLKRDYFYRDPRTGLEVTWEVRQFQGFPAVEWVLRFTNRGEKDTPIIENILPLDTRISLASDCEAIFHHGRGSSPSRSDFEPTGERLTDYGLIQYPTAKEVSQLHLPYFNLELPGGGLCGAIGWTGQWAVKASRADGKVQLAVGQQLTHLRLHPGESIRTPRILLVAWEGSDRMRGHNLMRRIILTHYSPRLDGEVVTIPIAAQTCSDNAGNVLLNDTAAKKHLESIESSKNRGIEAYWMGAGWSGDGGWNHEPAVLPDGLKPISDAAHKAGMQFILWFEPERVAAGTKIAREHPEWLLSKREPGWEDSPGNDLLYLGNPEARAWMTDLLSKRVAEYGVDILRQDRNFHLVGFWRANDAEDRQGITEIRHVEGLYAFWDELRKRHPRLVIDNASWRCTGPDLEAMSRTSGSFTRSENAGCGSDPIANQVATYGLSLYVPLHGNRLYKMDPYWLRSVCTTGTNAALLWNEPAGRQAIAEIKLMRPICLGDFYPLTPVDTNEESWCAWQFDRPDLDEGAAVVFRRPKTPGDSITLQLKGIDPTASYLVDFRETFSIREAKVMSGRELASLSVTLKNQPSSLLVHYIRVDLQEGERGESED